MPSRQVVACLDCMTISAHAAIWVVVAGPLRLCCCCGAVYPGDGSRDHRRGAAQPRPGEAPFGGRRHQQFCLPQGLPQPPHLPLQRALEVRQVPACASFLHNTVVICDQPYAVWRLYETSALTMFKDDLALSLACPMGGQWPPLLSFTASRAPWICEAAEDTFCLLDTRLAGGSQMRD